MMTIFPDMPTMRRRKHHYILDEHQNLVWTGAKIGAAMEWLWETGNTEFMVDLGHICFHLDLAKMIE